MIRASLALNSRFVRQSGALRILSHAGNYLTRVL